MPENEMNQEKHYPKLVRVNIPAKFITPHTFTAKDGRTFEKAFVDLPQGTKINGIDVGGYSCDVFMNDYMKQQMLTGGNVKLSFNEEKQVDIWKGKKGDVEHPYQRFHVSPWDLAKGIKQELESYKAEKAAERATEKSQGASLAEEVKGSQDAASALSGQSEGGFVPAMPDEEFYSIAEKHDIGEASLDAEAHAAREASNALDNPSSIDHSEPQRG